MPTLPCFFELPDDWLAESGMTSTPGGTAYTPKENDAVLVPLCEIEPMRRFKTSGDAGHGFNRTKMIPILGGIASGALIEALPLVELPERDARLSSTPFRYPGYPYRMQDGFHRFYASIATGFTSVPARITSPSELLELARKSGYCE
jgi:hypothetical protein